MHESPGNTGSEPQSQLTLPDAPDTPNETGIPDKGTDELSIFREMNELREESAKHFLLSDGSCMAVMYGVPVHELDAEGQWSDIDNSLVLSYNNYTTKDGRVSFAKDITEGGEIYTLSEGDTGITIGLVGAYCSEGIIQEKETAYSNALEAQKMDAIKNATSSLIYKDILKDTDIEYIVSGGEIKENIIVKEKTDEYIYSFSLVPEGLTLYDDEYGNILLNDCEGEAKYIIPAPVVYDANGEYADDGIAYYTVEESEEGFVLTVTVDADWMNDGSRTYPVTIDPTVTATSTASATLDTYLDSSQPNTSQRTRTYIAAGHGSSGQEFIGYWELTTLPTLPADSTITSAIVKFKINQFRDNSAGNDSLTLEAHQITSSWTSYLTWNQWQAGTLGQFSSTAVSDPSTELFSSSTEANINITTLARDWYSGSVTNYGIAIRQYGTYNIDTLLYSSDCGAESGNLPVFTTASGRNNLINNVVNQYNQRVDILPETMTYEVVIDVRGQAWTQDMLDYITLSITQRTNGAIIVTYLE